MQALKIAPRLTIPDVLRRESWVAVCASLAAVLILVAALGLSLPARSATSTAQSSITSTTTSIAAANSSAQESSSGFPSANAPSSASTLDSLDGLSLRLNVSTTSEGQVVITVYEFNTLDRMNNVTFGASPLLNSSFFQWENCDFATGGMVGYEVLEGDYGPNNYTSGAALWLELQPSAIGAEGCADINNPVGEPVSSQHYHYTFSPLSDGNVLSSEFVGYWSEPADAGAYHPFPDGIYTVVAADEWGNVVLSHFTIQG